MKRRLIKKQLRIYERRLASAVERCLSSPLERPAGEYSEAALSLLHAINNVVYVSLELDRAWQHRKRFLEYLSDESIACEGSEIRVDGEFIWWPWRTQQISEPWWPDDRTPHVTKHGGKYLSEPFEATLSLPEGRRRRLTYRFYFGTGKTRRLFRNMRVMLP